MSAAVPGATGAPRLSVETALQQPMDLAVGAKPRKKRQAAPRREGDAWKSVTVLKEHETSPQLQCNNCGKTFCGGHTTSSITSSEARASSVHRHRRRLPRPGKLLGRGAQKEEEKAPKGEGRGGRDGRVRRAVVEARRGRASGLAATAESKEIDDAIAELFYGDDLNHALANSPRWKKVIGLLKRAPPAYKPPDRNRRGADLLESTTRRLQAEEAPKRLADLIEYGGTIVSDGWDDVERNHLINLLLVAAAGIYFDGTVQLGSADHEDAEKVASIIKGEIKRVGVGPTKVVQVCTDTCSVMQKAWSLIRAEYPWITTTCCGPHVLSLLLKDIGEKIPEVAAIIANYRRSQPLRAASGGR